MKKLMLLALVFAMLGADADACGRKRRCGGCHGRVKVRVKVKSHGFHHGGVVRVRVAGGYGFAGGFYGGAMPMPYGFYGAQFGGCNFGYHHQRCGHFGRGFGHGFGRFASVGVGIHGGHGGVNVGWGGPRGFGGVRVHW